MYCDEQILAESFQRTKQQRTIPTVTGALESQCWFIADALALYVTVCPVNIDSRTSTPCCVIQEESFTHDDLALSQMAVHSPRNSLVGCFIFEYKALFGGGVRSWHPPTTHYQADLCICSVVNR
jgi:hypothetical protein